MKAPLAALLLALALPAAHPQTDPAALLTRLHDAQTAGTLDDPTLKPWHLKLQVTLYTPSQIMSFNSNQLPQPPTTSQGTIEEWWAGPNLRRTVYTFPTYQATYLHTTAGVFRSRLTTAPPALPAMLLREVVDPIPPAASMAESTPVLTTQAINGNSLDCIALTEPAPKQPVPEPMPASLAPTFCLAHGANLLRLSYNHGAPVVLRSAIGQFQGRSVPLDIIASHGTVKLATAHVALLETIAGIDPSLLAPTAELEAVHPAVQVDPKIMAAYKVAGDEPTLPGDDIPKGTHVVLMRLLIGEDGRVKEISPLRSSDTRLTNAALTAVRTWTYKPFLVSGSASDVLTTTTVTFRNLNLRTYGGNRPGIGSAPSPYHPR